MDVVILAAGRGTRLSGIAAPYMKPLLVVNGKPIIRQAAEVAKKCDAARIIIVAAPENALMISQVLNDAHLLDPDIILQRFPSGPGAALVQGLRFCTSDDVLVLMGDNITSYEDVRKVAVEEWNAIGMKNVSKEETKRFTWYDSKQQKWVEKVEAEEDKPYIAWIGPLKVNRMEMIVALSKQNQKDFAEGKEASIGPAFNYLKRLCTVSVDTIDVGIPESLT